MKKAVFPIVRHNKKLSKGPIKSNQGRVQLHRRVQKKNLGYYKYRVIMLMLLYLEVK